jgi:hypothetical protein
MFVFLVLSEDLCEVRGGCGAFFDSSNGYFR